MTWIFPRAPAKGSSQKSSRYNTSSHLHICCIYIFTPSHLLIYIFTPSHLLIYIFTPSHLLIYIFTPSHLLIYIFTPSHLLIYIFTPSHLQIYIFTPSHLQIYIFTPSHLQIYIFTPSHLSRSPLALLSISLLRRGRCRRSATKRNPFARHGRWTSKTEVKLRF